MPYQLAQRSSEPTVGLHQLGSEYQAGAAEGSQDPRREAWNHLLGEYPWDYFATLTYALDRKRKPETLEKHFRYWLKEWVGDTAVAHGMAWAKPGKGRLKSYRGWLPNQQRRGREEVVWCFAAEPHKSGRLHSHAVLQFPECLRTRIRTRDGWHLWHNVYRHGRARVEPPVSQQDVREYVSKYVTKQESSDANLRLSESFKYSPVRDLVKDYD